MKVGLALGGGGAKGSYQLGVLKALMENHMLYGKIDVVAGTSIGAINGLMVTGFMTYDEMNRVWYGMKNQDVYTSKIQLRKQARLFDLKVLYDTLVENLSVERIHQSTIKGFATLTKVNSYKIGKQINPRQMEKTVMHYNTSPKPHKIAIGSASVPLVFGATEIDECFYVDGGLMDNFSVEPLIAEGCDVIVVVPLAPNKFDPTPYLDKATIINLEPVKPLGVTYLASLNFNKELLDRRQSYGYELTNQMIAYFRKNDYLDEQNNLKTLKHQYFSFKNLNENICYDFENSLRDEVTKW